MILRHVQFLIFGRYLHINNMDLEYSKLGWENHKISFVDLYFTFFAGSSLDRGPACEAERHLQMVSKLTYQPLTNL